MISIIKDLSVLLVYLSLFGYAGKASILKLHDWLLVELATKIEQGLPSMTKMTEKMTCIRYDNNYAGK